MQRVIILDFGSGETNDSLDTIKEMVDKVLEYHDQNCSMKRIIIKFQLFNKSTIPALRPMDRVLYTLADDYCTRNGLECTASVFDYDSLNFLLAHNPVSVKIAARDWCYKLIDSITPDKQVFVSVDHPSKINMLHEQYNGSRDIVYLNCIPKYPANKTVYESMYWQGLNYSISDHTSGLDLYHEYQPNYFEKHVCSYHDQEIPDRSSYAMTIDEIGGIL